MYTCNIGSELENRRDVYQLSFSCSLPASLLFLYPYWVKKETKRIFLLLQRARPMR